MFKCNRKFPHAAIAIAEMETAIELMAESNRKWRERHGRGGRGVAAAPPPVKATRAENEVVAYHESGHAVAAWFLFGTDHVGHASIDGYGGGEVQDKDPVWATPDERVIISQCGPTAAALFQARQGKSPEKWRTPGDELDRRIVSQKLGRTISASAWDKFEKQATAILDANWGAVAAIAKELMERRTLSPTEIAAIANRVDFERACQRVC